MTKRKTKWVHMEARLYDAARMRAGVEGIGATAAIIVAKRLGRNATYQELEDEMFRAMGRIELAQGKRLS